MVAILFQTTTYSTVTLYTNLICINKQIKQASKGENNLAASLVEVVMWPFTLVIVLDRGRMEQKNS